MQGAQREVWLFPMSDAQRRMASLESQPGGTGPFFPTTAFHFAYVQEVRYAAGAGMRRSGDVRQVHCAQCALSCEKMASVDGYPCSLSRPSPLNAPVAQPDKVPAFEALEMSRNIKQFSSKRWQHLYLYQTVNSKLLSDGRSPAIHFQPSADISQPKNRLKPGLQRMTLSIPAT